MKQVSTQYAKALDKQFRDRAYAVVAIGVVDLEAQKGGRVEADLHYLSGSTNVFDSRPLNSNLYATMEQNVFRLDGSLLFAPTEEYDYLIKQDVPIITEDIGGSIKFVLDRAYDLSGLSITFTEFYPDEITLTTDTEEEHTYEVTDQTLVVTDFLQGVTEVTITPNSFHNGNNKRMRIQTLLMGIGIYIDNMDITDLSIEDSCSFVSEELPSITEKLNILDMENWFNVDNQNTYLPYLQVGQEMNTWLGQTLEDGSVEYIQMPKLYVSSWDSDNRKASFSAVDRIALMTGEYSIGNTIHSRTLYQEAESVFIDAGFEPDEYFIDDSLRDITIVNPMPVQSHNVCLQMIANAGRCILKQNVDGVVQLLPNFENIIDPTDLVLTDNGHVNWSKPENARIGTDYVYADMTENFFSADGSMYLLNSNMSEYLDTSFVSSYIADSEGNFSTNPQITLELPATFTYYGISMLFNGNHPLSATIDVYDAGDKKESVDISINNNDFYLNHTFSGFDKIVITFTKGYNNDRVVVNKLSFGKLTDYTLKKSDMMNEGVLGTLEERAKDISVRICTYVESQQEGEGPQLVDDNVVYTYSLNPTGQSIKFENPLIGTQELAEQVAEWLANYYKNNITYQVDYRGDPRLDSADIIYLENDYLNNLQTDIESHTIKFNGALSGSLNLRRAFNVLN